MMCGRMLHRFAISAGAAAIAMGSAGAAAAQTQPDATASAPASADASDQQAAEKGRPVLQDIVVTADRNGTDLVQVGSFRGAKQIDTPLTVSVISEQVLQQQQANGLLDALRNTPGVTSSQTSPTVYNNLSIRGIPVDNRENYRLNGVLPIVNLIDIPLENKARVEALKGASALYYGFTTPSGIINLTTKAVPNEPLFDIAVTGNDHGQIGGHLDVGNKWGILGVRASMSGGDIDSGIDHTRGYRTFQSGRVELAPADSVKLSFDVEHIFEQVTEPTVVALIPTATVVPKLVDPSTNPGADYFVARAEEVNLLGQLSWNISSSWNLTLDAGQSRETRDRNFTYLKNFDPVTGLGQFTVSAADGQIYTNRSYRAELAGTFATGPVVHELLVGVDQNILHQISPPATAFTAANCVTVGLSPSCMQNYYDPTPLDYWSGFAVKSVYDPKRDTEINDVGYYAFDRMKFGGSNGDLISVLAGLRKSVHRESDKFNGVTFRANPISLSGGLVIKPVSWASAYATYIEGLESTPPAPLTTVNASENLGASKSTQYEGGIKIKPKEGMLFTAAYFDITRQLTFTNSDNVFVKDGRATYRGVELSLTGQVTRDLSIYASAVVLSAKQGETSDPTLIGNRIENTAKATWSVSGEYRLDRLVPGLSLNGGVYYVGDRATNPQNSLFLPGYTLFDVGGAFTANVAGRPITFRINAENVGGKRYFASTGANYVSYGAPPMIKLSLSTHFF